MAALLNRFSLLAVYLAGFTLLFSFVAMYSGLRAYLSLQYGVDQQRLLLIRIAGAPGILLSPVLNKIFQRYRLSIINLPINDKHYL
jgi:hypothetical protein